MSRVEAEEVKRQAAVAEADAKLTQAFEQFERLRFKNNYLA